MAANVRSLGPLTTPLTKVTNEATAHTHEVGLQPPPAKSLDPVPIVLEDGCPSPGEIARSSRIASLFSLDERQSLGLPIGLPIVALTCEALVPTIAHPRQAARQDRTEQGRADKTPLMHRSPPSRAQALEITFQLSPGLHGAPRVLALARSTQDLAAAAGVFIPTSPYLLGLMELLHARRDGEARPSAPTQASDPSGSGRGGDGDEDGDEDGDTRVSTAPGMRGRAGGTGDGRDGAPRRGSRPRGADLSLLAGLGKEDLRRDEVRSAVASGAANLLAREVMGCYRWSASLPDMCAGMLDRLGRMVDGEASAPDGSAGKSRARVRWLRTALEKAAAEALSRRREGEKHPGDAGPIDTFRKPVRDVIKRAPLPPPPPGDSMTLASLRRCGGFAPIMAGPGSPLPSLDLMNDDAVILCCTHVSTMCLDQGLPASFLVHTVNSPTGTVLR